MNPRESLQSLGVVLLALLATLLLSELVFLAVAGPLLWWSGDLSGGNFAESWRRAMDTDAMFALQLAVQMVCFATVALVFARATAPPTPEPRRPFGIAIGLGLAAGFAGTGFAIAIGVAQTLLGLPVREQPWVGRVLDSDPLTLGTFAFLIVLVGPFVEELFFRGWVLPFLSDRIGVRAGVAISALVFAAIHFNPTGVMVYFVYGLILAWLARRTGRLVAPITAHATINGLAVAATLAAQWLERS